MKILQVVHKRSLEGDRTASLEFHIYYDTGCVHVLDCEVDGRDVDVGTVDKTTGAIEWGPINCGKCNADSVMCDEAWELIAADPVNQLVNQ